MAESLDGRGKRTGPIAGVVTAVLVGFVAVALIFVWLNEPGADNEVSIRALEESDYGVVYLEAHNIFVVATDDGPLALVGDVPHSVVEDRVRYCPLSDYFRSSSLGASFDRFGRYADGPGSRDLDRVALEIADGRIIVLTDEVTISEGRTASHDPAKGPACGHVADDPGFWLPRPFSP